MSQGALDERITIRLNKKTRESIVQQANCDGVTMTQLVRAIVASYLNWKNRSAII
jgi:predicted DNA binding CopG/RHH family protein